MRSVAIVVAALGVVVLWGWGAGVAWERGPWTRDDGCGHRTVSANPAPLVLGSSAGSHSSGKVRSAAEAEDQLLSPSTSQPLWTRIDQADIDRWRTALDTIDSLPDRPYRIKLAPGAKLLFVSKCD